MNILLLHTHDTGKFISPYGNSVPTEHIMEFAKDALTFQNMFCASPTCSPSRGAMMTSRYPHCNGLNGLSQRGHNIRDLNQHMANFWKEHGFITVLVGVQHERSFWRPYERAERASKDLGYEINISAEDSFVKNDTDLLEWDWKNAKQVTDFLQNYDGIKPFFLSYGTHATHRVYPELTEQDRGIFNPNHIAVPQNMKNTAENREDTARLHKSLACYDHCFGHVMKCLKETGLYDKTIIIYTTDHGLPNPFSKCGLRDAGMAVSFIMRVPGYSQSYGKMYDGLVSQIDVFPTLCQFTGTEVPDYVQGNDFSEVFEDSTKNVRNEVFAEVNFHASYEPQRCIRTDRYKYIRYFDSEWNGYNLANCDESPVKNSLIAGGIQQKKKEKEYLFDLLFDPNEMENLNSDSAYDKIKSDLKIRLDAWMKQTDDYIMSYRDYKGMYKVNCKSATVASSKNRTDYESFPGER